MKIKAWLIGIGMVLYAGVSLIDRFLIPIEDIIYVPIVIIAILCMLIGMLKKEN